MTVVRSRVSRSIDEGHRRPLTLEAGSDGVEARLGAKEVVVNVGQAGVGQVVPAVRMAGKLRAEPKANDRLTCWCLRKALPVT